MKKLYMSIGNKIRIARKTQKMTLEELADEANMDWSFLARVETGKAVPSLNTLLTISKILGLELKDLFDNAKIDSKAIAEKRLTNIVMKLPTVKRQKILQIIKLIIS
jgi:transcriptional regulator with XRE-family HTH domain